MNAPTLTSLSEDSGKSDTIIMPQSLWQMLHKLVSNLSLDMQTNGIKNVGLSSMSEWIIPAIGALMKTHSYYYLCSLNEIGGLGFYLLYQN